jgi:hypothetical protein
MLLVEIETGRISIRRARPGGTPPQAALFVSLSEVPGLHRRPAEQREPGAMERNPGQEEARAVDAVEGEAKSSWANVERKLNCRRLGCPLTTYG